MKLSATKISLVLPTANPMTYTQDVTGCPIRHRNYGPEDLVFWGGLLLLVLGASVVDGKALPPIVVGLLLLVFAAVLVVGILLFRRSRGDRKMVDVSDHSELKRSIARRVLERRRRD
jgi:hypothetical protein